MRKKQVERKKPAFWNTPAPAEEQARSAMEWLKKRSTERDRKNLVRLGIQARQSLGVAMATIQALAPRLGPNHELAAALWRTECYEARILAALVEDPAAVTDEQMERWRADFDNWGICDTACGQLFAKTPHAWAKVRAWSDAPGEFQRRAAFALLASLAGRPSEEGDEPFLEALQLIERVAGDERPFVAKGLTWALRRIGGRNAALKAAALELAERLAASPDAAVQWVGTDALPELKRTGAGRAQNMKHAKAE